MAEMSRKHPVLAPLATLMQRVADLRNFDLAIGSDNRSRFPAMPFRTATSRSQPPSKSFLFSQSSWVRSFLKPAEGQCLIYVDWSAAEVAIAASLSRDPAMLRAYLSGDAYLSAAKAMGMVPPSATKESHGDTRGVLKIWLLSVQYGATPNSLVNALPHELRQKLPSPRESAEDFIEKHRRTYRRYWQWADARIEIFLRERKFETTKLGWRNHIDGRQKSYRIRNQALNFPVQQFCAEIMRWAAVYVHEAGIELCATVHDAIAVGGPVEDAEKIAETTRNCMDRSSRMLLGFAMKTDTKIVKFPDRFEDLRGARTWRDIMALVEQTSEVGGVEQTSGVASGAEETLALSFGTGPSSRETPNW